MPDFGGNPKSRTTYIVGHDDSKKYIKLTKNGRRSERLQIQKRFEDSKAINEKRDPLSPAEQRNAFQTIKRLTSKRRIK